MKIGIICAMSTEHHQIEQLLLDKKQKAKGPFKYITGTIGENDVVLTQCGIGKVNSSAGAVEMIRNFHPNCIMSTGVAGGIDKSLNVMDVVVSNEIVYHDVWCGDGNEWGQVQGLPPRFKGNQTLIDVAKSLRTDTKIHGGLICSGDQFITAGEQLQQIKLQFPEGLAVDMESGSIAQVCYLFQIPFISFRIISDTPGAKKDNWIQYKNFWETIANRSFAVTKAYLNALPKTL